MRKKKPYVFQLIGDLHISNGKLEFLLEGCCWRNVFGKLGGVFPFLALPEEAVRISFQSFHSFSKIYFVLKLEVVVVLAEAACCYLWGFHSLILLF